MTLPTAAKSPAETLLERKLGIAKQLSCIQLFEDLKVADEAMLAKLGERADRVAYLSSCKAQVEDAKVLASLNVEGKNEAERAARKTEALRSDPTYQGRLQDVAVAEGALALLDNEIEELKRRGRRIERVIQYRTSVLEFLAG